MTITTKGTKKQLSNFTFKLEFVTIDIQYSSFLFNSIMGTKVSDF